MSRSATPATQNDITTCFETFDKNRFCSFPDRHCDGTTEASDSRRDKLEHQNEHFVRDFLKIRISQRQNRRFPTGFLMDRPQNRRFVRSVRRFSSPVTKCRACHGICTLSPLRAALTMRFTKSTQHDTSKVLRLPRKMKSEVSKVLAPATKNATHLLQTWQKCCACHTKTCRVTFWNVTKCHACPRHEATQRWKPPKVTPFAELT